MTGIEPTAHLVTEFSDPAAAALPWSKVVRVLELSEMFWLSTVRRDGRPHVAPLPGDVVGRQAALLHWSS